MTKNKKNCRRNKFIQFTVLKTTLLKATYIDVVVVSKTKKRKGCGGKKMYAFGM